MATERIKTYTSEEQESYVVAPCKVCGGPQTVEWQPLVTYGEPDAGSLPITSCVDSTCSNHRRNQAFGT